MFTQSTSVQPQPVLRLPVRQAGDHANFNLCDFDLVVLPADANSALQALVERLLIKRAQVRRRAPSSPTALARLAAKVVLPMPLLGTATGQVNPDMR
ncbi:MAG: hypothetical protein JSS14_22760 [Proteobacteria bacterium]|nr:hypothetical protein [Pseudomonadota bacterium]